MKDLITNLGSVLSTFSIIDAIDIVIVALIVYFAISLAKETRAMQLIKSIGVIFFVYFVAITFEMITLTNLLQKIINVGIIVIVVIFQPELRRAMERIGRSKVTDIVLSRSGNYESEETIGLIDTLGDAIREVIDKKDGALIVLERQIKLGDIIATGTVVDGLPSQELIANIFFKNSPMHDGALVISEYRVAAAGCYLPLSENEELSKELGTRHRAAIGLSEASDALVIVVSEERGIVSTAEDGDLTQYNSVREMKVALKGKLLPSEEKTKKSWIFGDKNNENK